MIQKSVFVGYFTALSTPLSVNSPNLKTSTCHALVNYPKNKYLFPRTCVILRTSKQVLVFTHFSLISVISLISVHSPKQVLVFVVTSSL